MNIYKRKDGRYEGRIYNGKNKDNKRIYRSAYGNSEEEVMDKLNLICGTDPEHQIITEMTVRELFDEWFKAVSARIKTSTAANYRMKAEKHIFPMFGSENCSRIKSSRVYDFIEKKLKDGLSARYVTDILVLLKSLFRFAAREYHINNVMAGIVMPKRSKPAVRLLNESELASLKKYVTDNPNRKTMGGGGFDALYGIAYR